MTFDELRNEIDQQVIDRLANYVYRLVDPRNGETFYVGVGKGTRVLDHVGGSERLTIDNAVDAEGRKNDDSFSLKLQRIKQISSAGLDVIHVIHRHGIESPKTAREVEAALIDAYPGLTNIQGGHGSNDFGCRHLSQIISSEKREDFVQKEDLILISIGRSSAEGSTSIYEDTRLAWRAKLERAKKYRLVVAHSQGVVLGVFRPDEWMEATQENFPELSEDIEGRIGFIGKVAESEIVKEYKDKRVPDSLRKRGAANPFRYVDLKSRIDPSDE